MTIPVKDTRDMTIPELYSLTEKVAIVTGAAKGIGLAIASRFAEAGATLLLVDIDAETLRSVTEDFKQRGCTVKGVVSDLSTPAGAAMPVQTAQQEYGHIDILVNNAGMISPTKHLLEADKAWWDMIIGVNLTGTFMCARRAAHVMAPEEVVERVLLERSFFWAGRHLPSAAHED